MPSNVSLESILTEIRKLKAACGIGLPARLLSGAAPKVLGEFEWSALLTPADRQSSARCCGCTCALRRGHAQPGKPPDNRKLTGSDHPGADRRPFLLGLGTKEVGARPGSRFAGGHASAQY